MSNRKRKAPAKTVPAEVEDLSSSLEEAGGHGEATATVVVPEEEEMPHNLTEAEQIEQLDQEAAAAAAEAVPEEAATEEPATSEEASAAELGINLEEPAAPSAMSAEWVNDDGQTIAQATPIPSMGLKRAMMKRVNPNDCYRGLKWYFQNMDPKTIKAEVYQVGSYSKHQSGQFKIKLTHPNTLHRSSGQQQNFNVSIQMPFMMASKSRFEPLGTFKTVKYELDANNQFEPKVVNGITHPKSGNDYSQAIKLIEYPFNHHWHARFSFEPLTDTLPQFADGVFDTDAMNKEISDFKTWINEVAANIENEYVFHPFTYANEFLTSKRRSYYRVVNPKATHPIEATDPEFWALHQLIKTKGPDYESKVEVYKQKCYDYAQDFKGRYSDEDISVKKDVKTYRQPLKKMYELKESADGKTRVPDMSKPYKEVLEVKDTIFKNETGREESKRKPMPRSQAENPLWAKWFTDGPLMPDEKDKKLKGKWRLNDIPYLTWNKKALAFKDRPYSASGDIMSMLLVLSYPIYDGFRVGLTTKPVWRRVLRNGPKVSDSPELDAILGEGEAEDFDPTLQEDNEDSRLHDVNLQQQAFAEMMKEMESIDNGGTAAETEASAVPAAPVPVKKQKVPPAVMIAAAGVGVMGTVTAAKKTVRPALTQKK